MVPETTNVVEDEFHSCSGASTIMSKMKIMKNLVALSLGFVLLFSAFMALANLESTMNNAGATGVVSQSIIYLALIISSLFLPKLVIKEFGCKRTILFSVITYIPYIAANFYPKEFILLPTAVLLGVGASNLWTAACTYINELSYMYANEDSDKAAVATSLFFGIFIMFFQTTQIWGNLVSFYVLMPSTEDSSTLPLQNNSESMADNLSCGASFCGGRTQNLQLVSDSKRFTLVGVFLAFSVLSAVIVGIFMDSVKHREKTQDLEEKVIMKLLATFKQMIKVDQLLLVIATTFCGLQQGFMFTDFTEAYIACAWGIQNVGLVFVCFGFVDALMSVWCGRLAKFVPRVILVTAAATSNICLFIALLYWKPDDHHTWKFFIVIGFWAFSDAIWQTQLIALYGILFRSDEEAAFANYRVWEALGYMIAFSCSSVLCIPPKIYLLIVLLVVGMAGYITVELRYCRRKKCYLVTKSFPFCKK